MVSQNNILVNNTKAMFNISFSLPRQFHKKLAPFSFPFRFRPDFSFMSFDYLFGNIEAETGTVGVSAGKAPCPSEFFEKIGHSFGGNADAGIFNFQQNISVFGNFGKADFHETSGRVFDGIVYEVGNDLADFVAVGVDTEIFFFIRFKTYF